MRQPRNVWEMLIIGNVLASLLPASALGNADDAEAVALRATVENDWALQDRRCGRKPSSPAAIRDALRRSELLLGDLRKRPGGGSLAVGNGSHPAGT